MCNIQSLQFGPDCNYIAERERGRVGEREGRGEGAKMREASKRGESERAVKWGRYKHNDGQEVSLTTAAPAFLLPPACLQAAHSVVQSALTRHDYYRHATYRSTHRPRP